MKFQVGPYTYALCMVDEQPLHDGKLCMAHAESSGRRITMWVGVEPEERLTLLLHELRHCWGFHVPRPVEDEEECDLLAMVSEAAYADLERQGGVKRLRSAGCIALPVSEPEIPLSAVDDNEPRYVPAGDLEHWQTTAEPNAERLQCGICETVFAGGSIVTSLPRFYDKAVGWIVDRTLYCGHCNHLQRWAEGSNLAGLPNGSVLGEPQYDRGAVVDEFLREHPEAAGMIA